MPTPYIHGYSDTEQQRLLAQARFLEPEVHGRMDLPAQGRLLELGCGVGAQTEILLERHPGLDITAVDYQSTQLEAARRRIQSPRARFIQEDVTTLTFPDASFDAAFVCCLLEHLPNPSLALAQALRVLKPGARIHLREVFNLGFWTSPESLFLRDYWDRFNQLQLRGGGDPFVGARLGALLARAGFVDIKTRLVTIQGDRRDSDSRAAFLGYLRELFLSGGPALLATGQTTDFGLQRVRDEFSRLERSTETILVLSYFEAEASRPGAST